MAQRKERWNGPEKLSADNYCRIPRVTRDTVTDATLQGMLSGIPRGIL